MWTGKISQDSNSNRLTRWWKVFIIVGVILAVGLAVYAHYRVTNTNEMVAEAEIPTRDDLRQLIAAHQSTAPHDSARDITRSMIAVHRRNSFHGSTTEQLVVSAPTPDPTRDANAPGPDCCITPQ